MKPSGLFIGYSQNNSIEVFNLRLSPIVLASLTMLILSSASAFAEGEHGADAIDRSDPSCNFVNWSYEKTYRSERLSFVVNELAQEGQLRRRLDVRFFGRMVFQRVEPDEKWRSWEMKERPAIFSSSGPVFSDCRLLREEGGGSSKLIVYSSAWRREQYRALITVWISEADGRIVKARSDFDPAASRVKQLRTASVINIHEYEADRIVEPRLVGF